MKLTVFTDGASRNNPGHAGIGIVIKKDGKTILEISDYIGKTTNNIAEYMAAIRGLTEALILGGTEIELFADSELLIKQIKKEYRVKHEGLKPLYNQMLSLIKKLKVFKAKHIKREENREADKLANIALDKKSAY
ncbi:hypothetical protein A2526_03305 [candidate division WOR-1 bacterium RIFOXYD2_FULL_36_8]|uniref:RNase H type-1 domain-containing protein n=1 Tax=candidate division WOR-1 bacterium RIFOXYB2_FULL_36_35 TaxID=1802578 RepID=A0A1F4RZW5_UNCSA|nr:MAG: hypothetical protein A2230_00260 [candidate division WOR-1 bacterium RIFOXYA2_FULL_36_21]OGC13735.1 MAG: hypothetical protein A2290_07670 [candidate division WOR-1 bacterium RIFOXYB2_FULL_36_35]OGC16985.1 MAG: hypothetical protein A2282_06260 [candidate division WOR-1 bacterium RIFOXYA12_FULL_36_13]OGC41779.1 MAG: hypothetical protein A2526_03305 [candidate division WOR-1 bacterium RIFOXYD2_FULL_36_8]